MFGDFSVIRIHKITSSANYNFTIFHIHYPDINECLERNPDGSGRRWHCRVSDTCVNVPGDFHCVGDKTGAIMIGKSLNVSSDLVNIKIDKAKASRDILEIH